MSRKSTQIFWGKVKDSYTTCYIVLRIKYIVRAML